LSLKHRIKLLKGCKVGLLGYGYTASYLAKLLVEVGCEVWGTSRDVSVLKSPVARCVDIVNFNRHDISTKLLNTQYILSSIPTSKVGEDAVLDELGELLVLHKDHLRGVGYLSSTSVYGDHQGGWVDESSECYAKTERAKNRLSAEQAWMSLCSNDGLPVMIFRLSGIYGPGRNVLDRLRLGKRVSAIKDGQYFSRIHVYDICAALYQSIISPMPGEIFNLSDNLPAASSDVDCFAADLLGVNRPRLVSYQEAGLSSMAKEFYASNRRVCNDKMRKHYLPELRFPTYKEGLDSILLREDIV
jgi:nucleoside-diphosphate-sugar epimerase